MGFQDPTTRNRDIIKLKSHIIDKFRFKLSLLLVIAIASHLVHRDAYGQQLLTPSPQSNGTNLADNSRSGLGNRLNNAVNNLTGNNPQDTSSQPNKPPSRQAQSPSQSGGSSQANKNQMSGPNYGPQRNKLANNTIGTIFGSNRQQNGNGNGPQHQNYNNNKPTVIGEKINQAKEKVQELGQKIDNKAQDVAQKVDNKTNDVNQKIENKSTDVSQNIDDKTTNMAQKIDNKLADFKGKLQQVTTGEKPPMQPVQSGANDANAHKGPLTKLISPASGNLKADDKTVSVEMIDRAHEIGKTSVENILKPLDKQVGIEIEKPLVKVIDEGSKIIRKPLNTISKPVEKILNGAFQTGDELAPEGSRSDGSGDANSERDRKKDESIMGDLYQKSVDLTMVKPLEVALKPLDNILGIEKDPIVKGLETLNKAGVKPLNFVNRPIEAILRRMGQDENDNGALQLALRFKKENDNPKLITRLSDGYINIADRLITKPLEIILKPIEHVLGSKGKKSVYVEAAHAYKNASQATVELFTKPLDHLINEYAKLGDFHTEEERQKQQEKRRQQASTIVKIVNRIHDIVQKPFELIIKPVDKRFGITKEGQKDPVLAAWDLIHDIFLEPVQLITKPIEDQFARGGKDKAAPITKPDPKAVKESMMLLKDNVDSKIEAKAQKKNIFINGIKKVEGFYFKPISVVTSPLRKLILNERVQHVEPHFGDELDSNGRKKFSSKDWQTQRGMNGDDEITHTFKRVNNVILKPFELITQPLSDLVEKVKGKKNKGDSRSGLADDSMEHPSNSSRKNESLRSSNLTKDERADSFDATNKDQNPIDSKQLDNHHNNSSNTQDYQINTSANNNNSNQHIPQQQIANGNGNSDQANRSGYVPLNSGNNSSNNPDNGVNGNINGNGIGNQQGKSNNYNNDSNQQKSNGPNGFNSSGNNGNSNSGLSQPQQKDQSNQNNPPPKQPNNN